MGYAEDLTIADSIIHKALAAAQTDDRVTVNEYEELMAISRRIKGLKHRQWQRDTFPSKESATS